MTYMKLNCSKMVTKLETHVLGPSSYCWINPCSREIKTFVGTLRSIERRKKKAINVH